ncbi:copper resistance CopC/CopD family protein [Stagnihabitans tardus]|uniref:Copper transport protein YcnJ n=1 Tax=Stagnihabitans tardus TaxID=2699202 RepID=A0AAE4YDT8_9RHOB|nr:CopD family protein [Stagnihabitans tardus]NBZ89483.1 hypothetical protein [Stagnihabitans tardus]
MSKSVQSLLADFAALMLWASMALAHAEFRGSTPAQNALLQELPPEVVLTFSEQVGVLALDWVLPDGSRKATEGAAGAEALTVAAPRDGGPGTYVLRWRVASTDGHPVAGALVFSVKEVTGTAPQLADKPLTPVLARGGFVLALVLAVGAAVFHHLIAPLTPLGQRIARASAGLLLPMGLLWLWTEGADRLGQASFAALAEGLQSPAARSIALGMAAGLLALIALRKGLWAVLAAWGFAALSFAVSGHALSAPGGLAPYFTALHGAALILWVGGLLPLTLGVAAGPALPLLARFSRLALPSVLVLIGSGIGLALAHRGVPEIMGSNWARLLVAKLGLVALMLMLALWHRFDAMPALERGRTPPLRRSLGTETALGLAVLCLAMGFRLAPPPVLPEPLSLHIHTPKAMVTLETTGALPGSTGFVLYLSDGNLTLIEPREVTLTLTDPLAGIGPLKAKATRGAEGEWLVAPQVLPSPGPWEVAVGILISDFDKVTLTGALPTPGAP